MVRIYINDEDDSIDTVKMESELLKVGYLYFLSDKEMMKQWTVLLPGKVKFYPDYSKTRPSENIDLIGYYVTVPSESQSVFFGENYYPVYLTKKDVTLVCYTRTFSDQRLWAESLILACHEKCISGEARFNYQTATLAAKESTKKGLSNAKMKLLGELSQDIQDILKRNSSFFLTINYCKNVHQKNHLYSNRKFVQNISLPQTKMADIDSYLNMFERKQSKNNSDSSNETDSGNNLMETVYETSDSESTLSGVSVCSRTTLKDTREMAQSTEIEHNSSKCNQEIKKCIVERVDKSVFVNKFIAEQANSNANESTETKESDTKVRRKSPSTLFQLPIQNMKTRLKGSSENKFDHKNLASTENEKQSLQTESNTTVSQDVGEASEVNKDQIKQRSGSKLKRQKAIYAPSRELPKQSRAQSLIFTESSNHLNLHVHESIVNHLRGRARLLKDKKFTSRSKSVDPMARYSEESVPSKKEWRKFLDISQVKRNIFNN